MVRLRAGDRRGHRPRRPRPHPEQAEQHIIGYTIYNDWSARDLQLRESPLAIGQAKGKDGATTLGPFLVTPDELASCRRGGRLALRVEAKVNGRTIGSGCTDVMDWSFGEVVSYASRGVDLLPGDVFGSGTVPGCCLVEHLSLADPASFPGWLRDGDVVELTVEGLGATRQSVRASAAPYRLAPRHNPDRRPPRPRVNRAPSRLPYTRGLHEVGAGVWAWLLPDGGYGWSNAGLIAGEGASLLVDTLFDLPLTAEMLAAMGGITGGTRSPTRSSRTPTATTPTATSCWGRPSRSSPRRRPAPRCGTSCRRRC
ncbi:fumarylacetoacetate hydrolase family protein [Nonomuraea thailandensis]